MKTTFAAFALAAALAQPAAAITFPTLTTIYIGSGVTDDGGASSTGVATAFICSNVSGATSAIRFLVLNILGQVAADSTYSTVAHGATVTSFTHGTTTFSGTLMPTGLVEHGVINIESTQSGVFCSAFIVDAADAGEMTTLPLVRVNPHPGTVE
jgi:hypothetical protein